MNKCWYFISKRGPNSEISQIWKVYKSFISQPNFYAVFSFNWLFRELPVICWLISSISYSLDCIDDVIVSVLIKSAVDREFDRWSGQNEDYKIGICCFSTKHAAFRRSKDWLTHNQDNVSNWSDMSTRWVFQWASTIKI